MITIVKCKKPKGYISTKIFFPSQEMASTYAIKKRNDKLLAVTKKMEVDISRTQKNKIKRFSPPKYLLTKVGSQFLLWKELQ